MDEVYIIEDSAQAGVLTRVSLALHAQQTVQNQAGSFSLRRVSLPRFDFKSSYTSAQTVEFFALAPLCNTMSLLHIGYFLS